MVGPAELLWVPAARPLVPMELLLQPWAPGPLDIPLLPARSSRDRHGAGARANIPQTSKFLTGTFQLNQNTDEYNFAYNQGFLPGETLAITFNNNRLTNNANSPFSTFYSTALTSTFNAQITQHLLQGFGWAVNGRYIAITKNNRRITDSAFRAQLLYHHRPD